MQSYISSVLWLTAWSSCKVSIEQNLHFHSDFVKLKMIHYFLVLLNTNRRHSGVVVYIHGSFCVEFVCSLRVCVGFLQAFQFVG